MIVDLWFIIGLTGFMRIIIVDIHVPIIHTVSYYYIINILKGSPLSTNSHSANDIALATRIHDPFRRHSRPPIPSWLRGNANLICDRNSTRSRYLFSCCDLVCCVCVLQCRWKYCDIVIKRQFNVDTIKCEMLSFYIMTADA